MIPRTLRGIRVVSFDIDGTLVDPSFVDSFWFDRIPRLLARRTGLSLDRAKARVLEEYDDVGDGDLRWYLPDYWLARLKLNVTATELLRGIRVRVYPEVREVLQDLRRRHELIVASNNPREFLRFQLRAIGAGYFSHTFSSVSDFALPRKTAKFYRAICRRIGVEPQEVAHVGDNPTYDLEVPRRVGIRAFHLDRGGTAERGPLVVRDLREFRAKIDRL